MFKDDFEDETLDARYQGVRRSISKEWANTTDRKGYLRISLTQDNNLKNPMIVATKVLETHFSIYTQLDFEPQNDTQKAGLVAYYSSELWYLLHISGAHQHGKRYLQIRSYDKTILTDHLEHPVDISDHKSVQLKISLEEGKILFYYSVIKHQWHKIGSSLSTKAVDFEKLKSQDKADQTSKTPIQIGMCLVDSSHYGIHADFTNFKYIPNQ